MNTFSLGDTQICVISDPQHGSQAIAIQDTALGHRLAAVLGEGKLADGYLLLEHTPEMDDLIMALVDILVSIRYSHPHLMQVQYKLPGY